MIIKWYTKVLVLSLMVGTIVFLYVQPRYMQLIDNAAACIISPFLKVQHVVLSPLKKYMSTTDIAYLKKQIIDLESERDTLQAELVALQGIRDFAQKTQELIRYKKRYTMDTHTLAHIILKHLNAHEQYIVIDQGSTHGVHKDMVAVYKNALIGRVTNVYPYHSKVVLITDPLCKVAVFCAQTKASGIAEGSYKTDSFVVTHVNHFDTVKKGDYIISSGAGLVFPKGFGLGTIEHFIQDGLFYIIHAKPLVTIDRIEYCYLIQKGA